MESPSTHPNFGAGGTKLGDLPGFEPGTFSPPHSLHSYDNSPEPTRRSTPEARRSPLPPLPTFDHPHPKPPSALDPLPPQPPFAAATAAPPLPPTVVPGAVRSSSERQSRDFSTTPEDKPEPAMRAVPEAPRKGADPGAARNNAGSEAPRKGARMEPPGKSPGSVKSGVKAAERKTVAPKSEKENGMMTPAWSRRKSSSVDEEEKQTFCSIITYINTRAGILKILQTVIGIVVLSCAAGSSATNAAGSALYFLVFVSLLASLNSLFSLLFYEYYGSPEERGLTAGELVYNAVSSILVFIAAFLFLLTAAIDSSIPWLGVVVATVIFSWILFLLYICSFAFALKSHKDKSRNVSPPESQAGVAGGTAKF